MPCVHKLGLTPDASSLIWFSKISFFFENFEIFEIFENVELKIIEFDLVELKIIMFVIV